MNKIALCVLMLAFAAASASAAEPQMGRIYVGDYTNYSGAAKDPGYSWWERRPGSSGTLIFTYEHFQRPNNTWDAYKVNWALKSTDSYGFSTWEITFKDGPQCQNVVVTPGGYTISFSNCSDGHSRYCYTL